MYKVRVEWVPKCVPLDDAPSQPIGGWDHNFPHVEHHADVIHRFFSRVVARWPDAIIWVDDDPRKFRLTLRKKDLPAQDLPGAFPEGGVAIIMRDEAMVEHTEREGAVALPDGENVLVLWFHPNPTDPRAHYLDLVTVDDELENEFSWWAVEQLWDVYLTSKKEHQAPRAT